MRGRDQRKALFSSLFVTSSYQDKTTQPHQYPSQEPLQGFRKPQVAGSIPVASSRLQGNWSRTEDRACGDDVDRAFECSVASRLFSEVGVNVEERIDAFEQSRFDFVRRAVNDV
jgi:hypothetical protein